MDRTTGVSRDKGFQSRGEHQRYGNESTCIERADVQERD